MNTSITTTPAALSLFYSGIEAGLYGMTKDAVIDFIQFTLSDGYKTDTPLEERKEALAWLCIDLVCGLLDMEWDLSISWEHIDYEDRDAFLDLRTEELVFDTEQFTGKGFPNVLAGESIFLNVCDVVFHEMRHLYQLRVLKMGDFERSQHWDITPEYYAEIKRGFTTYDWNLKGKKYEFQTLEEDANLFAALLTTRLYGHGTRFEFQNGWNAEGPKKRMQWLEETYGEKLDEMLEPERILMNYVEELEMRVCLAE